MLAAADARAGDTAAAEELFRQARDLMAAEQWDRACMKLEESYALDAGAGTLFNLAVCYEHQGRIATAWATYRDVAAATKAAAQPERERVARDRAAVLEPRLSYLTVTAPPIAELVVRRDESAVGPSQLGVAIPVDPGTHVIVASAPHRMPYRTSVEVTREGERYEVSVPDLAVEVDIEPPPPSARSRALPIAFGALGAVALGVGTYSGIRSIGLHQDSLPHCTGNACDQTGFDDRKSAITAGNVSTVFVAVGVVALGAAVVLWFVETPAPRSGGIGW
jgi:hypothetical protein